MADYVINNIVLTPYQVQYLRESMARLGLADRVFTSPEQFNEVVARMQAVDSAKYQNLVDFVKTIPASPKVETQTAEIPNSTYAGPVTDPAGNIIYNPSSNTPHPEAPVLGGPETSPMGDIYYNPDSGTPNPTRSVSGVIRRPSTTSDNGVTDQTPSTSPAQELKPITASNKEPPKVKAEIDINPTPTIAAKAQSVLDNPLHDYESYTYSLSWHLISTSQYNDLINNPGKSYVPQNVLVSSAGRYNEAFKRNPNFIEDFYFEDFKMTTVVNTTERNRNSNLIECSFTIIEPNGFTLINRLIAAVDNLYKQSGVPKNNNYLMHPYILQIDFFGYKDGNESQGPIKVDGQSISKVIPICLIGLKSKLTHRGAEYQIQAVPFNHQAFNQMHVTSPAALQIKGKTVRDMFGTGEIDQKFISDVRESKKIKDQLESEIALSNISTVSEVNNNISKLTSQLKSSFASSGFTDALNSWFKDLEKNGKIKYANKMKVVFDDEIGDAILYSDAGPVPVQQAAGPNQKSSDTARDAGGLPVSKLSFDGTTLTVPLGQPIDRLIEWVVRNSKYITDQMNDPQSNKPKPKNDGPLNWFRIIPKIEIGSYDENRNQYQFTTTLYVKKWTINTKHPYAPRGPQKPGYVKQYDWIFTGQNKDIIDMQIDFNMLYYIQMTALRNKNVIFDTAATRGTPEADLANDNNPNSTVDKPEPAKINSKIQPSPTFFVGENKKLGKRDGQQQADAVSAADAQSSFMLDSRGDMINLKLTILGDPQFIKQDDVFYYQGLDSPTGLLTANNSLYMDGGELYVFVTFHSPVDYDESTGLAVPFIQPNNYGYQATLSRSEFTGVYKIIKIENRFARGKFEQVLDLARLPIYDDPSYVTKNIQQRIDNYYLLGFGQNVAAGGASKFTGPNIIQRQLSGLATPIYNAGTQLASSLSGAGGLGGIVQSIVNAGLNKGINAGIDYLKGAFNNPTQTIEDFGLKAIEEYGGTYEDAIRAVESMNLPDVEAGALGSASDLAGDISFDSFDTVPMEAGSLGDASDLPVEEVATTIKEFFGF